jgi:D-alanyl-D-alanine dipeptidase
MEAFPFKEAAMTDISRPDGFVSVTDVIPDALLDVRYYSTYNFVGARVDGYDAPIVLLTKEAADALVLVNADMRAKGLRLVIYDGYRPQRAVDHFVRWAASADESMRAAFYPNVDKADLFERGFIARRSGHSRGSTVDLTLLDEKTGQLLDMGGPFDFFGELSHPDYAGVTEKQHANRMLLRETMLARGFKPLSTEWWHFTLKDEPYPDTYFDFPVR